MKVIGLTGGTGSGKSVVSKSLAAAGAVVIDADKIAHEIILKGRACISGNCEVLRNGNFGCKRKYHPQKAGEIVFHDAEKLAF